MGEAQIMQLANQLLWLVLIMSMPVVLVTSLFGLLISLIQALTQIQDQTVSFMVKLVAACITLALTWHWMGQAMMDYSIRCMNMISQMS